MMSRSSTLRRSVHNRYLAGVCGGLGEYFGIDATVLRVLFAIAAVVGFGSPVLIYLILWVVIPEREYY
ncbi:MAG: PspC domain-containing protein [Phycisphaerae bacterium]|nr:PspC domain-containing protein [Phycisphaerae bacterium]